MSRLIDKDAVLEMLSHYEEHAHGWDERNAIGAIKYEIENAPTIEQKAPDHGYMWICPKCGLDVHSDFEKCVRCGWEREPKQGRISLDEFKEKMKNVQIQVKPKQGHWIEIWENGQSYEAKCPECGRISKRPLGGFCRWCGCEMVSTDSNPDTDNAKYTCETCKHDRWHTKSICGKCVRQYDGKPSEWEAKTDCAWK